MKEVQNKLYCDKICFYFCNIIFPNSVSNATNIISIYIYTYGLKLLYCTAYCDIADWLETTLHYELHIPLLTTTCIIHTHTQQETYSKIWHIQIYTYSSMNWVYHISEPPKMWKACRSGLENPVREHIVYLHPMCDQI